MKWYFAFNQGAAKWFADMIRVAVLSQARHVPELEAHCLYDGDDVDITRWLETRGVTIHRCAVPFAARLDAPDVLARNAGTGYRSVSARGYYLCLVVPHIAPASESHVLFTDCDVMFTGPLALDACLPALLAAAPEMHDVARPAPGTGDAGFNSGVLVLNVAAMRERLPRVHDELERVAYYPTNGAYDQGALNAAIGPGEWDPLPAALNWRPAFGINPEARIVHWHGPKPRHVAASLEAGRTMAPDAAMAGLFDAAPEAYRYYYDEFRALLATA